MDTPQGSIPTGIATQEIAPQGIMDSSIANLTLDTQNTTSPVDSKDTQQGASQEFQAKMSQHEAEIQRLKADQARRDYESLKQRVNTVEGLEEAYAEANDTGNEQMLSNINKIIAKQFKDIDPKDTGGVKVTDYQSYKKAVEMTQRLEQTSDPMTKDLISKYNEMSEKLERLEKEKQMEAMRKEHEQVLNQAFKLFPDLSPENDPTGERWQKFVQAFSKPISKEEMMKYTYDKVFGEEKSKILSQSIGSLPRQTSPMVTSNFSGDIPEEDKALLRGFPSFSHL